MTYTTTISEAKDMIQKIIDNGNTSMNGFLHSPPGIGKSAVIAQLARDNGLGLVDLRLGSMEPSDVGGLPFVRDGEQVFSTPEWFPMDPDSKGIVFLDELTNAGVATQQSAYRFVLDRESNNGQKLPPGWFIIGAGNLQTDRTGVKGIIPALANRFAYHLTIEPSIHDFMKYAVTSKLNSTILGFLNFKPDYLHKFTPGENAFPTPRSWFAAGDLLKCEFSTSQTLAMLAGCVGEGTALEYLSFIKYYDKLPNFTKVMEGTEEYEMPGDDLGLMSAMTSSIVSLLAENYESAPRIKNLGKLMVQLPDESIILVYKILAGTKNANLILNVTENTIDCYNRVKEYIK